MEEKTRGWGDSTLTLSITTNTKQTSILVYAVQCSPQTKWKAYWEAYLGWSYYLHQSFRLHLNPTTKKFPHWRDMGPISLSMLGRTLLYCIAIIICCHRNSYTYTCLPHTTHSLSNILSCSALSTASPLINSLFRSSLTAMESRMVFTRCSNWRTVQWRQRWDVSRRSSCTKEVINYYIIYTGTYESPVAPDIKLYMQVVNAQCCQLLSSSSPS